MQYCSLRYSRNLLSSVSEALDVESARSKGISKRPRRSGGWGGGGGGGGFAGGWGRRDDRGKGKGKGEMNGDRDRGTLSRDRVPAS